MSEGLLLSSHVKHRQSTNAPSELSIVTTLGKVGHHYSYGEHVAVPLIKTITAPCS